MGTLGSLPSRAIINGLGNAVDFYLYRGKTPTFRRMPENTGAIAGALAFATRGRWSFITKLFSSVHLSVQAEAASVAGNSGWIWRDVLTSAAYGRLARVQENGHKVFMGSPLPFTVTQPIILVTRVDCRFQIGG